MLELYTPLSDAQKNQYINAEAAFAAWNEARDAALQWRGTMAWKSVGTGEYLIKRSTRGKDESLGARSAETERIYENFVTQKEAAKSREKSLRAQVETHRRLNNALRVGRTPPIVVRVLQVLRDAGVQQSFMTVGTNALYAYENALGVRVQDGATATLDLDLLYDTRRHLKFATQMRRLDSSFLGLLQKADKSFRLKSGQLYTAVNDQGFEVDVVRRSLNNSHDDPHPLRLTPAGDEDFWPVQISSGEALLSGRRFSAMVVASNGEMAQMLVPHPLDFVRIKRQIAASNSREPIKKSKDLLQAKVVETMVQQDFLAYAGE